MKNIFALAIMLFAFSATAGIRVIYGGGGIAEMTALSLLGHLEVLAWPCATHPQRCGLSAKQAGFLRDLLECGELKTHNAHLEFTTEPSNLILNAHSDAKMTLAQNRIYRDDGTPRPSQDIGQEVFAAWLMRPSSAVKLAAWGLTKSEVSKIAYQIFMSTGLSEESLDWDGPQLRVLNLHFKSENHSLANIFLQVDGTASDLTDTLVAQIPCGKGGQSEFNSIFGLHLDSGLALAHAIWRCEEKIFSGLLALKNDVTNKNSITVKFLNIKENDCASQLTNRN